LLLSELTASSRRLALVGLAKNTGKTVALTTLIAELAASGRRVGVTSVGRDGEERDAIDSRIEKPLVRLAAGTIVATTDELLRASAIASELLERTGVRTPLGEVVIARLRGGGTIEVAGPSVAAEVGEVGEAMLAHGAEQVLIDGAVDRRAAASPAVSDGLVMATGAVLSDDIEEVVALTRDAVALLRLPTVSAQAPAGIRMRELAGSPGDERRSVLFDIDGGEPVELPPRFVLSAPPGEVSSLLAANPSATTLLVAGALPEAFLRDLALSTRRSGRELTVVVADPTHVFLSERAPSHYLRQGVRIETLDAIDLLALTVNPVAPQSHALDSARLRGLLEGAIPSLEIFDLMDPGYRDSQRGPGPVRAPADG